MRTWVYRVAHNIATTHVVRAKAQMPAENIRAKAERLEQRAVAWRERRRALRIQNEIDELG